jgi:predicted nuclease with TOPRIM domain
MAELETYRTALKEARASFDSSTQRLRKIQQESSELNLKIMKLRRTITALAAMCSESPSIDALGITDSVMEVMEDTPFKMSTTDVVRFLEEMGFDLAPQKNAAASVHAILTRLAEKGKIKKVAGDDNKNVVWVGPNFDQKIYEITDEDIPF